MKYRITMEIDENGTYIAECPALPGCVSEGKSRQEVIRNVKDAINGYIISLKKHNVPFPPSINEEIVDILLL